ncbi:DUF6894 family protein [Microvirga calopogonii]|uniref:DUF6894 family protein n=1 Tax=Microvirga calopogonii TaxID=2078013 RepID=UPI000E0DAFB6|nr:hypothetical protein [Microvirga calopogonii]
MSRPLTPQHSSATNEPHSPGRSLGALASLPERAGQAPAPGDAVRKLAGLDGLFDAGGQIRCFFHLVKGTVVLTDDVGVDAADTETAIAEILRALVDLRKSDADAEVHWEGWSLEIVDPTGYVLSTISLDELGEVMDLPRQ